MTLLLPAWTLLWREMVRFARQPSRVSGALAQPLIMWIFLGAGMSASFQPPGVDQDFMTYLLPGIMLMILLFTAIFSTISIIEDRKEGFLQGVMVAPVSPAAVVLGKILGGAALGFVQVLLMLPLILLPSVTLQLSAGSFLALLPLLFGIGAGLTTVGVLLAWRMESTQGYHAIMMVVLFPAWFLSGAVFPAAGAPAWLAWPVRLNPMTHALDLIRACFAAADPGAPPADPAALWLHGGYFFGFSLLLFGLCMLTVRRR